MNPVSTQTTKTTSSAWDVTGVRKDFPILQQSIHGKPLVYLDNAASSQKPIQVIQALETYYSQNHANIHRGVHELSLRATMAFEDARKKIQNFIGAQKAAEIIFVRGTTEGINLVAQSYGRKNVQAGDEIVISHMEHHSNIVPWQLLCEEKKSKLQVIPINDRGEILLDAYAKLLTPRTKLVSLVHVSNTLGTINPVRAMIQQAHARGIPVLLDGAQAVPHMPVNVQELDCDFYVFSGHKMYGPTGIGVLYGKTQLLENMPPYQGGGDMISSVSFAKTTYNVLPHKFEAGTPNIADAIALGVAVDYLQKLGMQNIAEYEQTLLNYANEKLAQVPQLRLLGTAVPKAAVIAFVLEGIHAHDVGTIVDREGIAVRTGHHCTQPLMERFGVPATVRASFAAYNTKEEIDVLVNALKTVQKVFG